MENEAFARQHLAALNPQQQAAVTTVEGPVLLLAVPGSGKTTVLVTRLGYMVQCCGIPPEQILTMTYTVAATHEMRARFAARFGAALAGRMTFRTINGLCAADTVLIPLQCEYYALEGLTELMNTLKMVRKKYNRYLDIEGVLFTMYSGRLNLTMQVVAQVKKYYGDKVFKAVIPRSVRLSEAPSFGMPINFYEPNGKGCEAYMELAREFLSKNER